MFLKLANCFNMDLIFDTAATVGGFYMHFQSLCYYFIILQELCDFYEFYIGLLKLL